MQCIDDWSESNNPGEYDFRAPTMAEAHAQWHAVHGRNSVCPLDCGIGESYDEDPESMPLLVKCGHCQGRHTVAGVKACPTRPVSRRS